MNADYLRQIEAEREQRAQDKIDAERYRKLRSCTTVDFSNGETSENITGCNFDPARLDKAVDRL